MRNQQFKTMGGCSYRGAEDESAQARIMRNLERDWERHPELRAQYGNSFRRYVRSMRQNYSFGG